MNADEFYKSIRRTRFTYDINTIYVYFQEFIVVSLQGDKNSPEFNSVPFKSIHHNFCYVYARYVCIKYLFYFIFIIIIYCYIIVTE